MTLAPLRWSGVASDAGDPSGAGARPTPCLQTDATAFAELLSPRGGADPSPRPESVHRVEDATETPRLPRRSAARHAHPDEAWATVAVPPGLSDVRGAGLPALPAAAGTSPEPDTSLPQGGLRAGNGPVNLVAPETAGQGTTGPTGAGAHQDGAEGSGADPLPAGDSSSSDDTGTVDARGQRGSDPAAREATRPPAGPTAPAQGNPGDKAARFGPADAPAVRPLQPALAGEAVGEALEAWAISRQDAAAVRDSTSPPDRFDRSALSAGREPGESMRAEAAPVEEKVTAGAEETSGRAGPLRGEIGPEHGADGLPDAGTSHAPHVVAMNKAAQTSKDAGLDQQNLPGHGEVSPPSAPAPAATPETASPQRTSPAALQLLFHALERTEDIVQLHAGRLRHSGTDQLHVVIKPGAGVQLSMTLRQEGDRVHAEVWMHRGDLEFFQRHWRELQERCETRGIQLGDLQRHPDFQSHQQRHGYRPPTGEWADPLMAGAFAEFALAGSLTEPPSRRGPRPARHRGWETWA